MPVPYSDNLYSALDEEDDEAYVLSGPGASAVNPEGSASRHDDVEDEEALSPADGYFHASDAVAYEPPTHRRQSSNVPIVPNVLVEDPTLRDDDRDTKTREAENERRLSTMAALQQHQQQQQQHQQSSSAYAQSPPSSSSRQRHFHRRSVDEDEDTLDHTHHSPEEAVRSPLGVEQQQSQEHRPRPSAISPLFQQQHFDAPPAYTPSPTTQSQPSQRDQSPASPVSTESTGGYQTFGSPSLLSSPIGTGAMGLPSEHQRLLPNSREPESMGGQANGRQPTTISARLRRAFTVRDGRKKLAKVLKWLVLFVIVVALFSSLTFSGKHHSPEKIKDPNNPARPPGDENPPSGEPGPSDPKTPRPPVTSPDGEQKELKWIPRIYCRQPDRDFRIQARWGMEFGSNRQMSIVQRIAKEDVRPPNARSLNIEGEVVLRPSENPHPVVQVEVVSNSKDLDTDVRFDNDEQSLRISTLPRVEWPFLAGPCVQMRVTVFVPKGDVLGSLTVNTTQLGIQIMEGLDLGVESQVLLKTVAGNVNAPAKTEDEGKGRYSVSKRSTVIRTISGDVKGWFALHDLLDIRSVSGDLTLDIGPQEVEAEDPQRADLVLSTTSGDISATEPIHGAVSDGDFGTSAWKFPARDYYLDISTISGNTKCNLAFSSYANIRSESGDQNLRLWPVLDPQDKDQSKLVTNTKSGNVELTMLDAAWVGIVKPKDRRLGESERDEEENEDGKDPWIIIHPHDAINTKRSQYDRALGNLLSRHGTVSGDMRLKYPASWEGSLVAETISGKQRIRGEGLNIYDVGTPLMRTRTGRKGNGASDLKIVTVSGGEDVLIGREP